MSYEFRCKTIDFRRKTKDERRKTKDKRRKTKDERQKTKDFLIFTIHYSPFTKKSFLESNIVILVSVGILYAI